jgi:proteasome accessory factor A
MPALRPHGILFGLETEYAFNVLYRDLERRASERPDLEPYLRELLEILRALTLFLPDYHPQGIFTVNGSRIYIDCQTHPELATPECRTPLEVVCWQEAGERLLAQAVHELEARHPELEFTLRRGNVDYLNQCTWGAHESYLHVCSRHKLAQELMPHLVSRQIYTGAGGFDAKAPLLHFMLSPRTAFLGAAVGGPLSSEDTRGIVHEKDEPLSRDYRRWHLICGDSNASQLVNYLKVGITGLLVRLVDAGLIRAASIALENPLAAMKQISRDPDCGVRVKLADGREWSAIELQSEYFAQVDRHLGADCVPDWAPTLMRRWREVLDNLAGDPDWAATRLDWAIKRTLFRDICEKRGSDGIDLVRGEGLGAVLCELDMRLGEVGPRGFFAEFERAGVLNQRLPELEDAAIERAMQSPPPGGRAAARSRAIRKFQARRENARAIWEHARVLRATRYLAFNDPFAPRGVWTARNPDTDAPIAAPQSNLARRESRGIAHYRALEMTQAARELSAAARIARERELADEEASARVWLASSLQDCGQLEAAHAAILPALALCDRVTNLDTRVRLWTRHAVIEIERARPVAELESTLARQAQVVSEGLPNFGQSRVRINDARYAGARGRFAEAFEIARDAHQLHGGDRCNFAIDAHLRWIAYFALRSRELDAAKHCFAEWRRHAASPSEHYSATTHAAFSAELALIEERHDEALTHARRALATSARARDHRCRVHAATTFIESALAAQETDAVAEIAVELGTTLRRFETPYRRLAAFRALARWQRQRGDARAERRAMASARGIAHALGTAFGASCYEEELAKGLERLWAAGGST